MLKLGELKSRESEYIMKKQFWYCEYCTEEVEPENVTFQELHDRCGNKVAQMEIEENARKRFKGITVKQFEILEDVLSEIEESRVYEGENKIVLDELKEMFSYSEYVDFRDAKKKEN